MSTTYRSYNKKLKTKYEVGLEFIKILVDRFDGSQVEKGEVKIGVYDKKEADRVQKIIEKVLDLTQVRSKFLR